MKQTRNNVARFFEVVSVFIVFYWKSFVNLKGNKKDIEKKRAIYLRTTLEKLGSVFIKFGQLLALRQDFLPVDYCRELFYLLENVPPFSFELVEKIFKEELNIMPNKLFKSFNPTPVAAASFGQVHKVYLKTGEKVAIKVQRPNIKYLVEQDIGLMKLIAKKIRLLALEAVNAFEQIGYTHLTGNETKLKRGLNYSVSTSFTPIQKIEALNEISDYYEILEVGPLSPTRKLRG